MLRRWLACSLVACGGPAPITPSNHSKTETPICLHLRTPDTSQQEAARAGDRVRVCRIVPKTDTEPERRRCVDVDLAAGEGYAPRGDVTPLVVTGRLDRDRACSRDGRCTPLGPKARAALANDHERAPQVTADGRVVATHDTAWQVATDTPLPLGKLPGDIASGADDFHAIEVVGNLVVVSWPTCAGPCDVKRVITSSGRIAIDRQETGADVAHPLDDSRWGLIIENIEANEAHDELLVLDLATGAERGRVRMLGYKAPYELAGKRYELEPALGPEGPSFVPLGHGKVAVVHFPDPLIAVVDLDRLTLTPAARVPYCFDDDDH